MKRFYKAVECAAIDDGFTVLLDGRPLRTPAKAPLAVPAATLADAIAEEWRGQDEMIDTANMPLTRLAATAIDLLPTRRDDAIDQLSDFARTDLLCYRAGDPPSLIARQNELWDPPLAWLHQSHAIKLPVVAGIVPAEPDETAIAAVAHLIGLHDPWRLTALHAATTLTGSIVLGLMLLASEIDAAGVAEAAIVDERFAVERWGTLPEIEERHARFRSELAAIERWCCLLSQ